MTRRRLPTGVRLRPDGYSIYYRVDGKQIEEPAGSDLRKAAALRKRRVAEVKAGTWKPLRDQALVADPRWDGRESHAEWARRVVDGWQTSHVACSDPRDGYVYAFISELGPVKIGYTRCVRSRLATLQSAHPWELRPAAVTGGDEYDETRIHDHLEADRLRGEWYALTPEVVRVVELMRGCSLASDVVAFL